MDLGPIVGVAFILYRVALVAWLAVTCLAGARRNGDPLAILLFSYCGVELLYGELTGHGSVNGYGWLFAGLCLAAAKTPAITGQPADVKFAERVAVPRFVNLMR